MKKIFYFVALAAISLMFLQCEQNELGQNHEYVDLGLSVKWATCNVGATSPEKCGDYFAWGEVESKDVYDWSTYKYCTDYDELTKYCTQSSNGKDGFTDNKTILDPEDDAAIVNWGGAWRMPTEEEFDELKNNCTWIWITQNDVSGYKVTAPNGNSIFLPVAGYMDGGTLYSARSRGYYWSSSLDTIHPGQAHLGFFDRDYVDMGLKRRCDGYPVRPVCP